MENLPESEIIMSKVITKTVYAYNEFPEGRAKDKARNWLIDVATGDEYWYEAVYENWKEKLEGMGVSDPQIYFSGFWSQGDGAQFTGTVNLAQWLKYSTFDKSHTALAQAAEDEGLNFVIKSHGHYSHEYCTTFDFDYPEDDKAAKQLDDCQEELIKVARNVMRQIYLNLEKEYEYQTSEESLADMAEANDYTFDEYGNREG